jgi:hypothetical protein
MDEDAEGESGAIGFPEDRSLHGVAWWVLEHLAQGAIPERRATALASVLRVLLAIGPDVTSEEDRLAEVALRGVLMHGTPPRDEDEWALAEERFTSDAIEEFRRWAERDQRGPDG